LEIVNELIYLGADVEIGWGERRMTALMCAAFQGSAEVVNRLLQAGAKVNAQDAGDRTAIFWGAINHHPKIVQLLIEDGGDPNLGEQPLLAAATLAATEAVKVLVQMGADVEGRADGSTALHSAARANHTRTVKVLVEAGADVDALDAEGRNALYHAAKNGNVKMLRLLKAEGSSLDTPDEHGQTALHSAATSGSAPAVEEVLSWGEIDVNARTDLGATALHYAANFSGVETVELLIDAGADVNAVWEAEPGDEWTVLRVAALYDKPEVVQLLLKAGAEVDPSGKLLIEAGLRGCRGAVEVLLRARDWPEELKTAMEIMVEELGGPGADL
jgi:ankyrin repeat protein